MTKSRVLTQDIAEKYVRTNGKGNLSKYSAIDDDAALVLSSYKGYSLELEGIKEISPKSATALARCKNGLNLNGLRTISYEVASALSKCKDRLWLNGLSELSADAAKALSTCKGWHLALNGLTKLTPDAAIALGKSKVDNLYLDGIRTLTSEVASGLCNFKGSTLYLNGLREIPFEAAEALGKSKVEFLYLKGVTHLSREVAESLSGYEGQSLELPGLKTLSLEAAEALGKSRAFNSLRLNGLTQISREVAEGLGEYRGHVLDLSGLKSLSILAAEGLRRSRFSVLKLPEKLKLPREVAQALGRKRESYGNWTKSAKDARSGNAESQDKAASSSKKSQKFASPKPKFEANKARTITLSFWIDAVNFPAPSADTNLPLELIEAKKSYETNPKAAQKKHSKALAAFVKPDLILNSIDGGDELFENLADISASKVDIEGFVFEESNLPSCSVFASFIVPIKKDAALLGMTPGQWYDLLDERGIGFALSLAWNMELPNGETWTEPYEGHQGLEWEISG